MPKDYGLPNQAAIGLTGFGPEREYEDFDASYAMRKKGMSRADAKKYAKFMKREREKTLRANMKLDHIHAVAQREAQKQLRKTGPKTKRYPISPAGKRGK